MNCDIIQRRLFAAERPDQPDAEAQRHLADCPSCGLLQQRLVDLERDLSQLDVPASTRRAAFVQFFLQQTPVEIETRPQPQHILPLVKVKRRATPPKERGKWKLAFVLACAASLLIIVIGLAAMQFNTTDKTADYAQVHRWQLDTRMKLVEAAPPDEKADTVLGVADVVLDKVRDKVRTLAAAKDGKPKELADLAKFYRQLVREDLERQLKDLPSGARREVALKKYEKQLQITESEFSLLAVQHAATPAEQPLLEIALAARESCNEIQKMLEAG
jgi:hypothetical protein